jgi:hypothetical protein
METYRVWCKVVEDVPAQDEGTFSSIQEVVNRFGLGLMEIEQLGERTWRVVDTDSGSIYAIQRIQEEEEDTM